MRTVRKCMLLSIVPIATLTMMASSASAVEVSQEAVGHCSPVTAPTHASPDGAGGCRIRAISNDRVEIGGPAGMILCDIVFEARLDEDGLGFIYSKMLNNCNVPTVPCVETGGGAEAWPVNLKSTTQLEADLCLVIAGSVVQRCHLLIDVNQVSHSRIDFATGSPPVHRMCENLPGTSVQGSWTATADANHPAIEIAP